MAESARQAARAQEESDKNAAGRQAWPPFEEKYGKYFALDIPDWFVKDYFTLDVEKGRYTVDDSTKEKLLSLLALADTLGSKIPDDVKDKYFYEKTEKNGAEQWLPKTAENCLAVVKQNGFALEYVPENLKTAELCLAAVNQSGGALEYVPQNLKTAELCLAAVNDWGGALADVPENLRTPEICLAAVKNHGYFAIAHVPENLKTPELCLAAVSERGGALEKVPENLKTPEICLIAVSSNSHTLQYVPENLKNKIKAAVENVKTYREQGDALYKAGNYAGAQEAYSCLVKMFPSSFGYYNLWANCCFSLKQFTEAAAGYSRAIELNGSDSILYRNRAGAYAAMGDFERAVADYHRAIELAPDNAEFKQLLADAEAKSAITPVNGGDETKPETWQLTGDEYGKNGEHFKAARAYGKAIELSPQNPLYYKLRGNAYLDAKEYAKAIADYNEAIRLDPDNGAYYNNRGNAYDKLGENEKALADYNKALQLGETSGRYYNRADLLKKCGAYKEAIADYEKALALSPGDQDAAKGLAATKALVEAQAKAKKDAPVNTVKNVLTGGNPVNELLKVQSVKETLDKIPGANFLAGLFKKK
jgi:tetratricopeptide (TPR) repeat protein